MAFITVSGLNKYYSVAGNRLHVLRDLALTVEQGEMVAIMGASGVGKSTLLHVMGGLDTIDGGRVQVGEHDITTMNDEGATVTATAPTLENLILNLSHEITVRASLDATFNALLEQMGPANETPDGNPLPLILEAWPGGRWFRDLGQGNGHFWGNVQAIKRPTLLEISGPLFMSFPVVSNLQYRLTEVNGGTLMSFRHSALGFLPDDYRENLSRGWTPLIERVRQQAEGRRTTH